MKALFTTVLTFVFITSGALASDCKITDDDYKSIESAAIKTYKKFFHLNLKKFLKRKKIEIYFEKEDIIIDIKRDGELFQVRPYIYLEDVVNGRAIESKISMSQYTRYGSLDFNVKYGKEISKRTSLGNPTHYKCKVSAKGIISMVHIYNLTGNFEIGYLGYRDMIGLDDYSALNIYTTEKEFKVKAQ